MAAWQGNSGSFQTPQRNTLTALMQSTANSTPCRTDTERWAQIAPGASWNHTVGNEQSML